MADVIFTNQFTIQVGDTVRVILQDARGGVIFPPLIEHPQIVSIVGEVVMSMASARSMRDLLIQHIKDDPGPETMQ